MRNPMRKLPASACNQPRRSNCGIASRCRGICLRRRLQII